MAVRALSRGGRNELRTSLPPCVTRLRYVLPLRQLPAMWRRSLPWLQRGLVKPAVADWPSRLTSVAVDHRRRILAEPQVTSQPPVFLAIGRRRGAEPGWSSGEGRRERVTRELVTRLSLSLPGRLRAALGGGAASVLPPRPATYAISMLAHSSGRPNQQPMPPVPLLRTSPTSRTSVAATATSYVYHRSPFGARAGAEGTTVVTAGGPAPGGDGVRLDSRIERLMYENLEQWGRKNLNPKRIADEAYHTLVRQLGRERERLGR